MMVSVAPPRIEHHRSTLGIGERRPRLSWSTTAPAGWKQSRYDVEITRENEVSQHSFESGEQVLVPWPGEPLASRDRVGVRVRVHGSGDSSDWSESTQIELGLVDAAEWSAVPVGLASPGDADRDARRPPLVRRRFVLETAPVRARLYSSAEGVYECEINGARVGTEVLAPGWTVYGERLVVSTHDVTDFLTEGENVIGAWLGDGWYRGRLGFEGGHHDLYGTEIGLIAQLELQFADGSTATVASDDLWRAHESPIIRSGLLDGEEYDARDAIPDWSSPGFDDSSWTAVTVGSRDPVTLVTPTSQPIRVIESRAAVEVLTTPAGKRVLDFGQNFSGRVRIRVAGDAGDIVTIRTAEVMQEGELYTRTLRDARSTDVYTLSGRGIEEWEPRFTIHGFRYAEIEGWPGDLDAAVARGDVVAHVIHTDMERTGYFECSDPLVQRLSDNVLWSMRSNFVGIPTDCPQRDERMGWTGDIQVFAPTASFLYDVSGILGSWLRDLAIEQRTHGTVPWYVPTIPGGFWTPPKPGAVWGDAAVLTPWVLYERSGDRGVLAQQYESARLWVEQVAEIAGESRLWNTGMQLGDWLDPGAAPETPFEARTDKYLVATAYFFRSSETLAKMADVLGLTADADHYRVLAGEVRQAFRAEYLSAEGTLRDETQTGYALALVFGLFDEDERANAGRRLADRVVADGNRIGTGFAGTNVISDALSSSGQLGAAYDLLMQEQSPSWLSTVKKGATTIWERWDSLLDDGSVNPGDMTSFNHYALGAVADWLHRVVAGLAPASPGYRTVRIAPRPGGGLSSATARHRSPYGEIAVAWIIAGGVLTVTTTLPSGTAGTLELPGSALEVIGSGTTVRSTPWPEG